MYDMLEKCELFNDINEKEIKEILKDSKYKISNYTKGAIIELKGNICNKLLILTKGSIKTELRDANGKVIKLIEVSAPFILAPASLFGRENVFPIDITAIENDVTILEFSKNSVLKHLQSNKQFLINYLDIICDRINYLSGKIEFLLLKTIKQKIAQYLLNESKDNDKNMVILPTSQEELSNLFGVERPSLSRVLKELTDEGIIEHPARRKITIKNKNKLLNIIQIESGKL